MLLQASLFVVGDLLRLAWPQLWPPWLAPLLAAVALLAWQWRAGLGGPACLLLGIAAADAALQHDMPLRWAVEQRRVLVGRVVDLPAVDAHGASFTLLARLREESDEAPQRRIRVRWSGPAGWQVRAGDHWQLALRLQPLASPFNPDSPDTARNELRDHLQARGGVIQSRLNRRLAPPAPSLLTLRARLAADIDRHVVDRDAAALVAALAIGATADVHRGQWQLFSVTGITHLVAISGMHVTLFAVLAMAVVRRAWAALARRGLRWPREPCAVVAGLGLATGYALLAGFSVPTQRTLWMLSVFLGLRVLGRHLRPSQSLAVALVAVLLGDPFAVLAAGFWLSFLAVAVLVFLAGGHWPGLGGWRSAVQAQWLVFVALCPVTLGWFGSLSLAGLWVNALAIPYFTFVLVPAALLGTAVALLLPASLQMSVAGPLWVCAGWLASWVGPVLAWASRAPLAAWEIIPPASWLLLAVPAVLVALLPWRPVLRAGALLVLLPLLWRDARLPRGDLVLEWLDVGQATAVLVRSGERALLYGTGDRFGSAGTAVERAVLPRLRRLGVNQLQLLALPRLDRDSGAGTTALEAELQVLERRAAVAPGRELPPEFKSCQTTSAAPLDPGGPWRWRSLVLGGYCALLLEGPGGGVLLAQGLDAAAARQLHAEGHRHLRVVLAPRHLAGTGAGPADLASLGARWAVTSLTVAALPSPLRLQAYRDAGVQLHLTAGRGPWQLRWSGAEGWQRRQRGPWAGVWRMLPGQE
ncbi:MAG: hypothetical protein RL026_303 [Pseudomonadota bacterium]|jgi:competence protein ComEC